MVSAPIVLAVPPVRELMLFAGCMPAAPFADYIAGAALAGFDAVSVWPSMCRRAQRKDGLDVDAMRRIADDAGIRIGVIDACGDWVPTAGEAPDVPAPFRSVWSRAEFFAAAVALGAHTVVAAHLGGDAPLPHAAAVEGFGRMCDEAMAHDLEVALEFMPFSGVPDASAAWAIVRNTGRPNGYVVLDVCHHARAGGGDALAIVPADRVSIVQLADAPRAAPTDLVDEAMFHRALPGDGELGVVSTLAHLGAAGVRAAVGPELYRDGWSTRDPADVAADLMAATRRVLPG